MGNRTNKEESERLMEAGEVEAWMDSEDGMGKEGRGSVPELAWNVLLEVGRQVGRLGFFGEPCNVKGIFGHGMCLTTMENVEDIPRARDSRHVIYGRGHTTAISLSWSVDGVDSSRYLRNELVLAF